MQKELPPIFGRTDINTLPLSDTHEKSLCFQYLWELLFLHLIPDFCHSLISVLWSRFFGNQFDRIYCRGCHALADIASVLYKGLGLSQQAKRTRPGRGRIGSFFESVATLSMLALIVIPPPSSQSPHCKMQSFHLTLFDVPVTVGFVHSNHSCEQSAFPFWRSM